jgi:hypothetical protein
LNQNRSPINTEPQVRVKDQTNQRNPAGLGGVDQGFEAIWEEAWLKVMDFDRKKMEKSNENWKIRIEKRERIWESQRGKGD